MERRLTIRNRQSRSVNLRLLRRIIAALLDDSLAIKGYELDIHVVGAEEMTSLNERFLHHVGPTDVIGFDYSDRSPSLTHRVRSLHGEILLCMDEALRQSQRFRTIWQSEIVRYAIHGILHLLGHDDSRPAPRQRMKLLENRLLRELARRFPLARIARNPRARSKKSG